MAARCPDRTSCLHLVASAGAPRSDNNPDWSRVDGEFSRIPLGVGKVGRVGATGEAIVVKDFADDPAWLRRYQWAARAHISGLNVQPIKFKQEILGVLAIFTTIPTPEEGPAWLRIFADEIAGAIVNARAFEEIERLQAHLELENTYLQEEVREARAFGDIIGQTASIQQLLRQIELVAPTDASVLILGESGTGKELVAREVHRLSRRAEHPLIRVNCASVPRELYESEFFGHVKGAFTGAIKDRAGRFEAADGGTLFLDEVGEVPFALQSKFLRVLQEKQYERVGEEKTRTVDVRIIAASNRDLKKDAEEGRFRQDFYYRLNVFPIEVPPLRERKEDIPMLAAHFLQAGGPAPAAAAAQVHRGPCPAAPELRLARQRPGAAERHRARAHPRPKGRCFSSTCSRPTSARPRRLRLQAQTAPNRRSSPNSNGASASGRICRPPSSSPAGGFTATAAPPNCWASNPPPSFRA